jgi:ribonuclease M5
LKQIQEVIVVEGYHDLAKLKQINPLWDIVITNGSEISEETMNELELLQQKRGIILLMDPDFPGERIRTYISQKINNAKHAYVPKEKCISNNGKKIGIEHALEEDIIKALNHVMTPVLFSKNELTVHDMFELGLSGCFQAKENRKIISKKTGIWLGNSKRALLKLNMFGIKKEDLKQYLKR